MAQATAIRIAPQDRNKLSAWRKFIANWELLSNKKTPLNERIDEVVKSFLSDKQIPVTDDFPKCSEVVMPAFQADLMLNRVLKNKPDPSTPLGIRFAPLLMKIETEGNVKYKFYTDLVRDLRQVLDQTEMSETIESEDASPKDKVRVNAVWVMILTSLSCSSTKTLLSVRKRIKLLILFLAIQFLMKLLNILV
jgi:hypothetical protein